jgi:pyridoxal phosphate enzyme (YggS family)
MNSVSRDLSENLAHVRERIELAATQSGRAPEEISLIAVSKSHPARKIQELYEAGVRHFGENRVQERESKLAQLQGVAATWHMIGHLQKNKAARAVSLFSSIDTVDSIALADKLDRARADLTPEATEERRESIPGAPGNRLRVLIEVKLDPEPAKSGVADADLPGLIEAIQRLPHLDLQGLMGVPPYFADPEEARPYFRHLRELRDTARKQFSRQILPVLSMGMSHDFEIAIQEGATELRVGTALFGTRESA